MEKEYVGDLILLRGVPGSGKTTLGNIILFNTQSNIQDVLSADNFFVNEKGEYIFDATKLKEAHNDCQVKCAERMRNQFSKIVVANTFTQEWEMEPYFIMAERYNYRIHSVIVENRHGNKNIHNVPDEKISQMTKRFEIKL
jgi:tRNA uridine 5-carbamoylmethylation protein Kti12